MAKTTAKAEVKLSRCPKCGSTDREKYHNVRELFTNGLTAEGDRYNCVVWRRTRCANCCQVRVDRSFEMRKRQTSSMESDSGKTPQGGQSKKGQKPPRNEGKSASQPAAKTSPTSAAAAKTASSMRTAAKK